MRKPNAGEKILDLILHHDYPIGPTEIQKHIPLSRVMIHRYLKQFLREGLIEKFGTGPQACYGEVIKPEFDVGNFEFLDD